MIAYFTHAGYLVVALAMLAEGLTLPCPAVAVLLMAGAAVAGGKLSFWIVVVIAGTAYTIGSIIPYYLGRNIVYIQKLAWAEKLTRKSAKHLTRLSLLFDKHGDQMVAFSRPFWIGNFVSYFAGLARMSLVKFLVLTFSGIFTWSLVVVSIGEAFSSNLPKAAKLIKEYSLMASIGVVVILIGAYWFRTRKSRCVQN